MADDARQILGKHGEDLACAELERLGYASLDHRRLPAGWRQALDRRYRTTFGEIDIVASEGGATVFVEVKTRIGEQFGGAAEALTSWKQRRLTQMAVDYLARHRLHDRPCRFDVVAIDMDDGRPRIQVYAHAFDASC